MSKIQLNKSSPQNFEIIFPKIPTESRVSSSEELTLNIFQTVIPSVSLESEERSWQGGVGQIDAGRLTFEPFFVNFTVDSELKNWLTIWKWMTFIHNNENRYGGGYKTWIVDATLKITDNNRKQILVITFESVWPNMLGEVTLSHREGETQLQSNCNFMYNRYTIRELD